MRTPTVLQMEAVECGAACLAMVLAYYGRIVPLEELRLACGVSRDGTKAGNVVRAARTYGLTAKGFSKETEDLGALPLPMIVFWNFNHFVVVEGFGRHRVYLNDPGLGRRIVSSEEFEQSFTGVVLVFEPGPDFSRGGARPDLLRALGRRLRGSEAALAYVLLATLALVVPGLATPALVRAFVDGYVASGRADWAAPVLWGLGLTALVTVGLTRLQQVHLLRLETKLAISTSSTFFWHLLRLPVEFFTQRYGGEVGARVQINDSVATLLSGRLATTALSVVMIAFYAVLMVQYDVVLTLTGIGIAVLNAAALEYLGRRRVERYQQLLHESGKLLGTSIAGLQMIETIKATSSESEFFVRWSGYQAKVENARQALGLSTQMLIVVPGLLAAVSATAILTLGALRVMDGHLTPGMLVAFQLLMVSFLAPVGSLVSLGVTVQQVEGEMRRLDDVLRYEVDRRFVDAPAGLARADLPTKLSGQVELRKLTFGYSRLSPPLIEELDLTLRPGDWVALVGASGSGKSTVAKLVAGLYEPWSGEILFDGQPRRGIPADVLRASLAMVDQEIFLFEGTVRENLTLWDSTIPETDIVAAAKDACIHDDVAARPGGYDNAVEEGGRNYSGGQRQRLEIARALVGNPSVLILDEATSALDPVTELRIADNVRRRGPTCLIVAHRLSTIRDCDEIIVLERGRVVQRGTHEQLRAVDGPYARLIAME